MKKLIYLFSLVTLFTACGSEDDLKSELELTNDFMVTAYPDADADVQRLREEIYASFKVPVFFNDTIAVREIGTDYYGKPIIQYETVDLNWQYTDYSRVVEYSYDFLEEKADKMNSLNVVKSYLEQCSASMRPFSILLVDTVYAESNDKLNKPEFQVGYRTLVIAQVKEVTGTDAIDKMAAGIISKMVVNKVAAATILCDQFKELTASKGWYGKGWGSLKDANPDKPLTKTIEYGAKHTRYNTNNLFYSEPYAMTYDDQKDFVDSGLDPNFNQGVALFSSREEAEAARCQVIKEIGAYGFLRGSEEQGGMYSPDNSDQDRNQYVRAIMSLDESEFIKRYGESDLVMKKFEMLRDYIVDVLKVEL